MQRGWQTWNVWLDRPAPFQAWRQRYEGLGLLLIGTDMSAFTFRCALVLGFALTIWNGL
jgi:hypothetical protein